MLSPGPVTFKKTLKVQELQVDGYVNNMDIDEILDDAVEVNDSSIDFTGTAYCNLLPL